MNLFDEINDVIKKLLSGVMQQLTITDEDAFLNDNVSKVVRTRVTAELCSTLVKLHNLKISDHQSMIKKLTKWLIDNQNADGSWNEKHIKYDKPVIEYCWDKVKAETVLKELMQVDKPLNNFDKSVLQK